MMQVKLVNARDEVMLLPEEMAVEGWPSERELPGVEIQARHGRVIDLPMARMQARSIRVSGTMAGVDKQDADAIREMVVGFVHRANPLRLYRHEDADRYMLCYAKGVDHRYTTGRFLGRVFTLSLTLEAADPLFYGPPIQLSRNLYGDSYFGEAYYGDLPLGEWYAANRGTAASIPVITITAGTLIMGLVLTNLDNGKQITIGDMEEGDVLRIDCNLMTATLNGTNALNRLGSAFLVHGFELADRSPNHLKATTANATEPFVNLAIDARERYY